MLFDFDRELELLLLLLVLLLVEGLFVFLRLAASTVDDRDDVDELDEVDEDTGKFDIVELVEFRTGFGILFINGLRL